MNYNRSIQFPAMGLVVVRSVRTNELQRKKLEKYLTNSKVRLVRANELQHKYVYAVVPDKVRCAPCTPTNYNGYQPTVTNLLGRVRLTRTHELQLNGRKTQD